MLCPLCGHRPCGEFFTQQRRHFHRCGGCDLVYVDASQRLLPDEEKARYEEHNNDVRDPRYQDFVRPLYDLVFSRMGRSSSGLDFGAGTGPVLAQMLRQSGYNVQLYDPFFWPEQEVLNRQYDFVVTSEVVEHFYQPALEFRRLASLVRPEGLLGIMTLLHDDKTDLPSWYYLKDPTHVCAYSIQSFEWLAKEFGFEKPEFRGARVIALKKTR